MKSMNSKTTEHRGGKHGKWPVAKGHVKFEQIVMLHQVLLYSHPPNFNDVMVFPCGNKYD